MASNNVSSMSCEELCSFLEDKKIPDDVITTIKDQEIDGEVFINLSDEEISEITKKIGTRKKLKQLQKNSSQDSSNYTRVKYGEKNYCLSNLPSSADYVVVEAAKEIEGQLRLQNLGEDLTTLGRFVRIAHFGVVGHPELQIKVRTSLRSVFELCHDTAHTLNDFKRTSQEALESLQTAYQYLSVALEEQALKMLLSLQDMSSRVKTETSAFLKKCNEQSKVIKEIGDTTLQKRTEIIEERKENESKIDVLTDGKQQTNEEIQEAESEKEKAQIDLKSAYCNSEKEGAINELIKATKDNQKQTQDYIDKKHVERKEIASHHRKEVAKAEKEYASSIKENEKKYLEKLTLNKNKLQLSSDTANQQYETALAKNINDLSEKLEQNKKWLLDEQAKIEKQYQDTISINCRHCEKKIRNIENDYDDKIRRIEETSRNDLRSNQETFDKKLEDNREALASRLSEHYKLCQAEKSKTHFYEVDARAELDSSKVSKDVKAENDKVKADKEARDAKLKSDDSARNTEIRKKQDAYNSKEKELQPHRDEKSRITNEALQVRSRYKNEADSKKVSKDDNAKKEKASNDIKAKTEKNEALLNAEKTLQTDNENVLNEKNESNKEAKSAKTLIIQKLEEDYKHELEKLEKDVEDFKKHMQSTLDSHATKIQDIKEKQQKNQQAIDESKKSTRQAQHKMRQVIEQITQCKSRAEIHKVTEKSLHQAMGALNEIEAIMINVGNFWKDVEGLCASVTMDPDKRKVIWQSQAFKVDALNFYGKWIALKAVCTTASGSVNSALDEVRRYMVENPDEDKAFQSIQDMAGEFLKELPSSEEQ